MNQRPSDFDTTKFPDPVYAETVLGPLYAHAKSVFSEPLMRINRAHLVMLAETGILGADEAGEIAAALDLSENTVRSRLVRARRNLREQMERLSAVPGAVESSLRLLAPHQST